MAIPVVDLAEFSGNPQQKAAFVDALGKAYEDVGFVAVKNHGIPAATIDGLYSNTKEFLRKYSFVLLVSDPLKHTWLLH